MNVPQSDWAKAEKILLLFRCCDVRVLVVGGDVNASEQLQQELGLIVKIQLQKSE